MKQSAGILLYKFLNQNLHVLLVHPGGPFFAKKDEGAWSIPKGEFTEGEDALETAKREFLEETGQSIAGSFEPLEAVKQKGGKRVYAWAVEGDLDTAAVKSNDFELEWPPRSGKIKCFPEIDRAEWFYVEEALGKILPAQQDLIHQLVSMKQKPDTE